MSTDNLASGWAKALGGDRKQFDMFIDKMIDSFAYHRIVVDKEGKPVDYVFLEVNHAFETMTGLKREKVIGKKVTEVIHSIETDPADWIGVYGKVALTGAPIQFENLAAPLGKWFKVSAYCPEKGYFVAIFEDITERKKAAQALKESEQRYHQLFTSMTEQFQLSELVYNEKGCAVDYRILDVNPAFERLVGKTREQLIDKQVNKELWPVEQYWLDMFDQVLKTGQPAHYDNYGSAFDRSYELYVYRVNGNQLATIGIDITERKKAEEALSRINEELEAKVQERTKEVSNERQRLYNVLETLPAYIVLLDKDYRMPFANKVFREVFGESQGRRCHEFLFDVDSECENCVTYNVLKTNKPQHWEWTGPNNHNYEIYDYPFVEADGSTLILEMGLDVTERKKAEQQAQEVAKKLKDAERLAAIGATAGMVGHDIRNPLQAITSDLYLVKTELAELSDNEQKKNAMESLDEIQNNIDYINKIVADLQDFARPLNPRTQETDITSVFNEMITKNGMPKNVSVTIDVEGRARHVKADPDYLKRIFGNLTLNATQAMPDGGKLIIRAYIDKQTNDTLITVGDTGVGIPDDVKPKLFTPMMTTKSKGQGFGLAVVKRMTEGLGGKVSFESEEGKGTTFIVRLPPPKG